MNIYDFRRKRLNALIKEKYRYRKDVADASGWSEARISQILSPTYRVGTAFGERVARKLEAALGLPIMYFDQGAGSSDDSGPAFTVEETNPPVVAVAEIVTLPEYRLVPNDGDDAFPEYEELAGGAKHVFFRSWLSNQGINPKMARMFRVEGDSMVPMIFPGDAILVNREERNIVDGKVYALLYGSGLRVKILSRRLDGTVVLRSVNPKYPDEEILPVVMLSDMLIVGRVRQIILTEGL